MIYFIEIDNFINVFDKIKKYITYEQKNTLIKVTQLTTNAFVKNILHTISL